MIIYVSGHDTREKELLIKTLYSIELTGTAEEFKKHKGCSEPRPGLISLCRDVSDADGYEVSFGMTVVCDPEYRIKDCMIIDENFGQPHPTNRYYNRQIIAILNELKYAGAIKFKNFTMKEGD